MQVSLKDSPADTCVPELSICLISQECPRKASIRTSESVFFSLPPSWRNNSVPWHWGLSVFAVGPRILPGFCTYQHVFHDVLCGLGSLFAWNEACWYHTFQMLGPGCCTKLSLDPYCLKCAGSAPCPDTASASPSCQNRPGCAWLHHELFSHYFTLFIFIFVKLRYWGLHRWIIKPTFKELIV